MKFKTLKKIDGRSLKWMKDLKCFSYKGIYYYVDTNEEEFDLFLLKKEAILKEKQK